VEEDVCGEVSSFRTLPQLARKIRAITAMGQLAYVEIVDNWLSTFPNLKLLFIMFLPV
jgi:hypothetical protein